MRTVPGTLGKLALLGALALARPALADEADDHFAKGKIAFNASKYDDALREFQAAWTTRKTHDLAASMAQAETQLGKHRDAAEHLAYALSHFPVSAKEELRAKIQAALKEAKTHVATLQVTVTVAGCDVLVDGASIGRAPLDQDVFVEPGPHTFEARLAGHVTGAKKIEAKAGATDTVALVVVPEPVPTATITATSTATAITPPTSSKTPAYIVGGVGAVGAIVGGVLLGVGFAQRGDVEAKMPRDSNGKPLCVRSADAGPELNPDCPSLRAALTSGQTMANVGLPLSVIGGLAVAGAAVYLLWPSSKREPAKPASRVFPVANTEGAALVWMGSF